MDWIEIVRIWILSDLHMEFEWFFAPDPVPEADVCVLAGDLLNKGIVPSIEWMARKLPSDMPLVFTAGNHEFYRAALQESISDARRVAAKHNNLHFLENDAVEILGFKFVGATLWTDFELYGDVTMAMDNARAQMNDYRMINYRKSPFERLQPGHTARKHQESRHYLASELAGGSNLPTVVVTHHAPSLRSVEARYINDNLTAAFASNMDSFIERHGPRLWVHGHVHHRVDYMLGSTRVVANPRGYPNENSFREFDASFVIDV